MLRLRKSKLLPQQVSDLGAFIFVVAMIPVTYLWEMLMVSPALWPVQEEGLAWAWAGHMLFGLLVIVNIAGNFAGNGAAVQCIRDIHGESIASFHCNPFTLWLMLSNRAVACGHIHHTHRHPLVPGRPSSEYGDRLVGQHVCNIISTTATRTLRRLNVSTLTGGCIL
jgi:hypothetical protein